MHRGRFLKLFDNPSGPPNTCHVLRVAVLTLGAQPAFRLFRRIVAA